MENKEGYSRRNAFVPVPTVTSFEEFNEHLWKWCEQDAQRLHYKHKVPIQELWEVNRESLLTLPEYPFPVFRYEALSVERKPYFFWVPWEPARPIWQQPLP